MDIASTRFPSVARRRPPPALVAVFCRFAGAPATRAVARDVAAAIAALALWLARLYSGPDCTDAAMPNNQRPFPPPPQPHERARRTQP